MKKILFLSSILITSLSTLSLVSCFGKHKVLESNIASWNETKFLQNKAFNNYLTNMHNYNLMGHSAFLKGVDENGNPQWISNSGHEISDAFNYSRGKGGDGNSHSDYTSFIDLTYFAQSLIYYYEKNSSNFKNNLFGLKDSDENNNYTLNKINEQINCKLVGQRKMTDQPVNPNKPNDTREIRKLMVGRLGTLEEFQQLYSGIGEIKGEGNTTVNLRNIVIPKGLESHQWTVWDYNDQDKGGAMFLGYYVKIVYTAQKNKNFKNFKQFQIGGQGTLPF